MDIYSIYKVTNLINLKGYVGFTGEQYPLTRWKDHEYNSKYGLDYYLYRAIRKYEINSFSFEVIYQSRDKKHTLDVMEEYFIRLYNTHAKYGWGYNMTYGGQGLIDPSPEVRAKMSLAQMGNKKFVGHIPWSKGKKLSKETCAKMSASRMGHETSLATRNKISQSHKDIPLSEEHKAGLRKGWLKRKSKGYLPWNKGLSGLKHKPHKKKIAGFDPGYFPLNFPRQTGILYYASTTSATATIGTEIISLWTI